MLRITVWTTTVLLGAALAGCGGGAAEGSGGGDIAQYEGAIASNDVARGEQVVTDVCMGCHAGGAPSLENIAWDPARMRQQIREGSGRMPALGVDRVSGEDLEASLAYMVTIGAVASEGAGGEPTTGGEADPMDDGGAEPMGEEGDEPMEDADEDFDEDVEEGA